MDWSPEPVAILYSTQLYDRPLSRPAPLPAVAELPDEPDVEEVVPVVVITPGVEVDEFEPVQPAIATAITTSMIMTIVIREIFIQYTPDMVDMPGQHFPFGNQDVRVKVLI